VKNWVFDLGAVLLEWNPQAIAGIFTADIALQKILLQEIFQHPDWLAMDRGELPETGAIPRAAQRTNLNQQQVRCLFNIVRESLTVIPGTLGVLEAAKAKGLNLYCLSNMSPENYAYLKQKYPFFSYFHGIVISGLENVVKPDKKIFEILLQRFALQPEETLFIDDRPENIRSAQQLGMSAITFSASDDCFSKIYLWLETAGTASTLGNTVIDNLS
jgi:putative hydrolase of the HAD superfamily